MTCLSILQMALTPFHTYVMERSVDGCQAQTVTRISLVLHVLFKISHSNDSPFPCSISVVCWKCIGWFRAELWGLQKQLLTGKWLSNWTKFSPKNCGNGLQTSIINSVIKFAMMIQLKHMIQITENKYINMLNSKVITKIFTKTHDCQVDLLSLQANNNFSGSCFRIRELLNFGNLSFFSKTGRRGGRSVNSLGPLTNPTNGSQKSLTNPKVQKNNKDRNREQGS